MKFTFKNDKNVQINSNDYVVDKLRISNIRIKDELEELYIRELNDTEVCESLIYLISDEEDWLTFNEKLRPINYDVVEGIIPYYVIKVNIFTKTVDVIVPR